MTFWKVQLDAAGSFPAFKVQRYRAVIEAPSMDEAGALARRRLGIMGRRMTLTVQPFDDREAADVERAADWFVNRGFPPERFAITSAAACRSLEP